MSRFADPFVRSACNPIREALRPTAPLSASARLNAIPALMATPTGYTAYAGIGARETPGSVCDLMTKIAACLGGRGFNLRSGHAAGADRAFEAGALPDLSEIYLPWRGFDGAVGGRFPTDLGIAMKAEAIAGKYHPAWDRLSRGVRSLHARNVLQVLGERLDSPSKFILCWTPGGGIEGGTGQAMRIAIGEGVPVFNLRNNADRDAICAELGL